MRPIPMRQIGAGGLLAIVVIAAAVGYQLLPIAVPGTVWPEFRQGAVLARWDSGSSARFLARMKQPMHAPGALPRTRARPATGVGADH